MLFLRSQRKTAIYSVHEQLLDYFFSHLQFEKTTHVWFAVSFHLISTGTFSQKKFLLDALQTPLSTECYAFRTSKTVAKSCGFVSNRSKSRLLKKLTFQQTQPLHPDIQFLVVSSRTLPTNLPFLIEKFSHSSIAIAHGGWIVISSPWKSRKLGRTEVQLNDTFKVFIVLILISTSRSNFKPYRIRNERAALMVLPVDQVLINYLSCPVKGKVAIPAGWGGSFAQIRHCRRRRGFSRWQTANVVHYSFGFHLSWRYSDTYARCTGELCTRYVALICNSPRRVFKNCAKTFCEIPL